MNKVLRLALLGLLFIPTVAFASWWNPFTWFTDKQPVAISFTPSQSVEVYSPSNPDELKKENDALKAEIAEMMKPDTKPTPKPISRTVMAVIEPQIMIDLSQPTTPSLPVVLDGLTQGQRNEKGVQELNVKIGDLSKDISFQQNNPNCNYPYNEGAARSCMQLNNEKVKKMNTQLDALKEQKYLLETGKVNTQ